MLIQTKWVQEGIGRSKKGTAVTGLHDSLTIPHTHPKKGKRFADTVRNKKCP